MVIRCVQPFGNFKVGDKLEIPDEAVFDETYFECVPVKGSEPAKGGDK